MNFGKVLNQRGFVSLVATLVILLVLVGVGVFYFSNTGEKSEAQIQSAQGLVTNESSVNVLHETCQEYFDRRISEGWEVIEYDWPHAILLSPDGIRRELDLRNNIETLRPNAPGDASGLSPEPVVPNWQNVDEVDADDDDTSVGLYMEYETGYDLYHIPDHSVGSGTINKITVYFRCWCYNEDSEAQAVIKSDTTTTYGSLKLLWASWHTESQLWVVNPADSEAWEWADIDALQIGVALDTYEDRAALCTQVYVEVDYTELAPPTVTTQAVSDIGQTTAMGHGTITETFENCSKRGVCWNTTGNPTVADSKSEETDSFGTGAFERPMTVLTPGQHYYVKAYAYNSAGYGYSSQVEFTTNQAPTNDELTLDLTEASYKGAKTLLTGKQDYKFVYKVSDADGVTDINYAEIGLDYADKNVILRATRGEGDTWTFSEQSDPNDYVTLNTGGSSHSTSGNQKTFNFLVTINWNWDDATETLGVRAYVIDSASASDTDDYTNVFGVENDLTSSSLTVDDYRCNPSQTLTMSGYWYYEGTSIAPPDGNYNVIVKLSGVQKGTADTTLDIGAFSISDVTAESTVGSYSYTVEATYMASAGSFPAVVTDRIRILTLIAADDTIPVGTQGTWYTTAELEHDNHALGSGDSFTLSGYSFSWSAGSSGFETTDTKNNSQTVTINAYDSGLEATYGITAGNINALSQSIEWQTIAGGAVPIAPPVSVTGYGNVSENLGGEVRRTFEFGQIVKVVFPSYSIKGTIVVRIEPQDKIEIIKANPLPQNTQIIGDLVADFKALSGGKEIESFEKEVSITFTYSDNQVKEAGIDETTLKIYRWDKDTSSWQVLPSSKVNTATNSVTASTLHFTLFAVIGETKEEPVEEIIEEALAIAYEGIPTAFTFEKNLKYDDENNDVKYLQIILKIEVPETYPADVPATGWFGPITKASVIAFQEKYVSEILAPWDLTTGTGYVGSTTRAKLNSLLAAVPIEEKEVTPEVSGIPADYKFTKYLHYGQKDEEVRYLQIFLKAQGPEIYPEGLVTGYFKSLTEVAVKRFQIKYEIVSSEDDYGAGYVGPKTRAKINEILGR